MLRLFTTSAAIACTSLTLPLAHGPAANAPRAVARQAATQQPGAPAAQPTKPPATAKDLVEQGKQLYRTAKLPQALRKFSDALKLEAENDEALGLGAITAFRLGHYAQARDLFARRVNVPGQKETVKAYSHYWTGLSYWREAHERLALRGEIRQDRVTFKLGEKDVDDISAAIRQGLEHLDRALAINRDYAEAHNVKNLLHAEAALLAAAGDEARAEAERQAALESLRQALKLHRPAAPGAKESADFGAPTVRVAEFARTKDEHAKLVDPMMKHVEGGQPVMQAAAALPGLRAPKQAENANDPAAGGVTSDGGAYSVGSGRGALNAAYAGGRVKIEVLVSTAGNVVFARVVDGRGDLNGPALAAAKKWKFTPAKFEGRPVQLNGVITFNLRPGAARPTPSPTPAPKT
jgi:TonB family protein